MLAQPPTMVGNQAIRQAGRHTLRQSGSQAHHAQPVIRLVEPVVRLVEPVVMIRLVAYKRGRLYRRGAAL